MSAPRLRVLCDVHTGRTVAKVIDTPNGLEYRMQTDFITGDDLMHADRLPAWCPDCHRAYWLDGKYVREALRDSRRVVFLDADGVLHSPRIEAPDHLV